MLHNKQAAGAQKPGTADDDLLRDIQPICQAAV